MTDCRVSQMLSRSAKVELLRLLSRDRLYDAITGTKSTCAGRCWTERPNREWKYLNALAEEHFGYFCYGGKSRYGDQPLKGVTDEAYKLAWHNAELDKFVMGLFDGGEELYIPGVIPSSELIPTIIQAFKMRSSALVSFRPLRIRFSELALHFIWPDAGERRIRPCPFCVPIVELNSATFPTPHVTDRYHIRNAETGQQLTIEISQHCRRPDDAYGVEAEFWARTWGIDILRIVVDNDVQCQPLLPDGPKRTLALSNQEDMLLEASAFASRDDLDALQLSCKFWRDVLTETAGTLALRPLQRVYIGFDRVNIERAPASNVVPGAVFDVYLEEIHSYGKFRIEDVPVVIHEQIVSSLSLSAELGAKDFNLQCEDIDGAAPSIFANEVLLNAKRFQLQTRSYKDGSATSDSALSVREHCHQYLRKAVGCHVSFLQNGSYAPFDCDDIIERFLAAVRSDDFVMPLSIQTQFDKWRGIPKPTNCKHPTLCDVAISHGIHRRFCGSDAPKFDVYHFDNERTHECLTVCLGKDCYGTIGYVFLQRGRIMASLEEIGKMQPFPYQFNTYRIF